MALALFFAAKKLIAPTNTHSQVFLLSTLSVPALQYQDAISLPFHIYPEILSLASWISDSKKEPLLQERKWKRKLSALKSRFYLIN